MFRNLLVVDIPYLDGSGSKTRPVVQLTDILDEYGNFQVAYITSKISHNQYTTDILININHKDFSQTGLSVKSMVRTSKIYTVNQTHIQGLLGVLPPDISQNLNKALKYQFNL